MSKVLAVIPSRYGATRFPGKPLALINGREMILRVLDNAAKCKLIDDMLVATDDERILNVVTKAGFKAVMTKPDHASGTDRIAEAVTNRDEEILVNIQGDEPTIDPASVDKAVQALLSDDALNVSTLATPIKDMETYRNPNAVKVVFDKRGDALYFSRSPIPYSRDGSPPKEMFKHLGLYVYRRKFLVEFSGMEQGTLEKTEMLEQLRILQNGVKIRVVVTAKDCVGIDSPEDLKKAEAIING
ncbi:MAG: 3-deoxy-manno-octulosonate cytidylyltransferase [Nitrospinae bacterium]|nr:3-deoxy-manno-octulosonate cytidylyltransferase [Nitrospinota bacterium]